MKKVKKILSVVLSAMMVAGISCSSNAAYASEARSINEIFISESNYADDMENIVVPFIDDVKETGYVDVGGDGFEIYYEKYVVPGSKASIVISHGFTESLEKYHEIIYYYMNQGFSVYGLEHRGHGRSGHLGKMDSTQVSTDDFNYYVSDLKAFLDNVVVPETDGQKLFLFAHSMGGGIGARFLEVNPGYFDAAVLSAPMLEVNTGNVPGWAANMISNGSVALSFGDKYVAGQGPYNTNYDFSSAATQSEPRYAYYQQIELDNPEIQRGGASYKWLQSVLDACKKTTKKENVSKVKIPVLLFQAEKDDFVKAGGQNTFAKYAPNCILAKMSGAKHEIYREKDGILKVYLNRVMEFYNSNL